MFRRHLMASLLVLSFAAPALASAAAKTHVAPPDFSGAWAPGVIVVQEGIAAGMNINLRDVNWAPLSAGAPEARKPPTYAEQMAFAARLVKEDRDVFAPRPDRAIRVPYTVAGQRAAQELQASKAPVGSPYEACLPANRVGLAGPLEIYQRPDRIGVMTQTGVYRVVHLDRVNRGEQAPTYAGLSNAHWEGDRLVVVTTNFAGPTVNGWPMSPQAKVTETFALSPDRRTLSVKTVYEDAVYLKEPMGKMIYLDRKPADYELLFTDCVENVKGAADYAATFGDTPPVAAKPF